MGLDGIERTIIISPKYEKEVLMGVFSDHLSSEVRLERMRPEQVEQAKRGRPAIYVPFGSIEWHGITQVHRLGRN